MEKQKKIIIIGAGIVGNQFFKELNNSPQGFQLSGFVDEANDVKKAIPILKSVSPDLTVN